MSTARSTEITMETPAGFENVLCPKCLATQSLALGSCSLCRFGLVASQRLILLGASDVRGFLNGLWRSDQGAWEPAWVRAYDATGIGGARGHGTEDLIGTRTLVSSLRHPSLPVPLGEVEVGGRRWAAQARVEGRSLAAVVTDAKLQPEQARRLLRDLLDALAILHDQGLVACDLAPEHVVIALDGSARLVHLDCARRATSTSEAAEPTAHGVPGFMAPEQAMGEHRPQSDLYALGRVLSAALDPKSRDRRLRALIGRLTHADWRRRPASAAQAAQVLDRGAGLPMRLSRPAMVAWSCAGIMVACAALAWRWRAHARLESPDTERLPSLTANAGGRTASDPRAPVTAAESDRTRVPQRSHQEAQTLAFRSVDRACARGFDPGQGRYFVVGQEHAAYADAASAARTARQAGGRAEIVALGAKRFLVVRAAYPSEAEARTEAARASLAVVDAAALLGTSGAPLRLAHAPLRLRPGHLLVLRGAVWQTRIQADVPQLVRGVLEKSGVRRDMVTDLPEGEDNQIAVLSAAEDVPFLMTRRGLWLRVDPQDGDYRESVPIEPDPNIGIEASLAGRRFVLDERGHRILVRRKGNDEGGIVLNVDRARVFDDGRQLFVWTSDALFGQLAIFEASRDEKRLPLGKLCGEATWFTSKTIPGQLVNVDGIEVMTDELGQFELWLPAPRRIARVAMPLAQRCDNSAPGETFVNEPTGVWLSEAGLRVRPTAYCRQNEAILDKDDD